MKTKGIAIILIFVIITIISACGKKVNTEDVRKYSDSVLENVLMAGNEDDYAAYSKDFSDKMKSALTEDLFKQNNKMIKDKIGEYISKEFIKVNTTKEKGTDYAVVIYNAKYSNEPQGAMVSITFKLDDSNHKVEGLFMTSPKLVSK